MNVIILFLLPIGFIKTDWADQAHHILSNLSNSLTLVGFCLVPFQFDLLFSLIWFGLDFFAHFTGILTFPTSF